MRHNARLRCDNIKAHARKRIQERLNFVPNKEDFKNMVKLIQDGETELVRKQSNRVTIHKMNYKDQSFLAVYDKQRQLIVTVLYGDRDESN